MVATQSITLCYLAPVRFGPARATAHPLRVGKRDAVVQVHVVDAGREDRLCATGLITVVALASRD
jgi:uncharacterized protein (TIGR00369 family)